MSAEKWTRNEIWAWYCSQKVDKYKLGRKKSDKTNDEKNIRLRAVINNDRLILGLWKGCKGERCGVYYITSSGGRYASFDGKKWESCKLEYVPRGGYWYWGYTYGTQYNIVSGEHEARAWLSENFSEPKHHYSYRFNTSDTIDWIDDIERDTSLNRREITRRNHQQRIDDWLADLPGLPADINEFVDETVCGGLHFAFGNKDSNEYHCSVCAELIDGDKWKHGKFYECPKCGARLKCNKKADEVSVNDRITLIQSYHDKKGEICSIKREMYVSKKYTVFGESSNISDGCLIVLPLDGSTANGDNCYYWEGSSWTDKNRVGFSHRKSYCYPNLSALDGTAYDRVSIEAAARKGWKLHYNNMMRYFCNEPKMEYLVKGNFYGLVEDMTTHLYRSDLMKGNTAKDVLGIDGQSVARLRDKQGGVDYLQWLRSAFMCGFKLPEKAVQYFCKHSVTPTEVAEPLKWASPEQIANYIEKQRAIIKQKKQYNCTVYYITTTWRDTLQLSGQFKLAANKANIFPKDLCERHEELVAIQNLEREKERMQELDARFPEVRPICDSIRDTYSWENNDYAVIVPTGVGDIITEGTLLRHCVGTPDYEGRYRYLDRITSHESYIMFLRKKSDINAPWYTMEVEPGGAVRQLRTTGDDEGADRSEAKAVLAQWRRAVAKRVGQAEREAAEVSREKRLAEFEELRRNGNIIRNGKLAGKLLVEVLEADFKEYNEEIA